MTRALHATSALLIAVIAYAGTAAAERTNRAAQEDFASIRSAHLEALR